MLEDRIQVSDDYEELPTARNDAAKECELFF